MGSFIIIEGFALWVILICLIIEFIVFCMLGCGYLNSQKEIYRKDKTIKRLRADNNLLLGMYIRDTETEGIGKRDG